MTFTKVAKLCKLQNIHSITSACTCKAWLIESKERHGDFWHFLIPEWQHGHDYLPKSLPLKVTTQACHNDSFVVFISSCAAKFMKVWKELSFIDNDDLQTASILPAIGRLTPCSIFALRFADICLPQGASQNIWGNNYVQHHTSIKIAQQVSALIQMCSAKIFVIFQIPSWQVLSWSTQKSYLWCLVCRGKELFHFHQMSNSIAFLQKPDFIQPRE